ncbi:DUF2931 family protein [uncultured Cytophaga sp.]|uniref:DUF2931 family protein n=1 Tax=uncultured Cytophaga sp. TaxID=160238 RepID=UPI00261D98E0|nr:DUF2931 family protein [uncultured Cytophaga sp.]
MTPIHSLCLLVTLVACTQKEITNENNKSTTMNQTLEWAPGVCAPELYPVEVYRGDFYTETDWLSIPNGGIVEAGWGDNGMNMDRGGIIPDSFSITYFAYMENKFYTGKFALPKQNIEKLFREGVIDYGTKKYETYYAMIVGMAPGGVLVVWMQTYDKQVEIGRYQASEMDLDWEIFNPRIRVENKNEYVSGVVSRRTAAVSNFKKNGLMLGLWDTYRIKYNWRPVFEFPKGSKVDHIDMKMYNGEQELLWGDALTANAIVPRAITWRTNMLFFDETGQDFGADIDFDETELFEAYKQIFRNDKAQDGELVFKYNDNRSSLIILLRNKTEEIELRKCKISIFKRTK